jgi:hypothetical protein
VSVLRERFIYALGVGGTFADYVTSQVGLMHPRILELNPLSNPFLEGVFALAGSFIIFRVGKALKVSERLVSALALIPACVPVFAAIYNIIIILLATVFL